MEPESTTPDAVTAERPQRLLDQVRHAIRYRHYSYRAEQAYAAWVRRFVLYHGRRHPKDLGADEVETFLRDLATSREVSASTHQQALSALLFLYREVLAIDLPWLGDIERPKKPKRLPVVLSREEVQSLLAYLEGTPLLLGRRLSAEVSGPDGAPFRLSPVDWDALLARVASGAVGEAPETQPGSPQEAASGAGEA